MDDNWPEYRAAQRFNGYTVHLDSSLADSVVAWEKVRSIPRAMRRIRQKKRHSLPMKQIPKRDVYTFGTKMVMHPETWKALEAEIAKEAERIAAEMRKRPKYAFGEPKIFFNPGV